MNTQYIWKQRRTIQELNELGKDTLGEVVGMEFTEIGDNYLVMSMPVNKKTHQPYGLLHGGASAALIETIGSVASNLCIDPKTQIAVGIELNCSHLRGVRSGTVFAVCTPIRIGRTLHVWDVKIKTETQKICCVGRLTVNVITRG